TDRDVIARLDTFVAVDPAGTNLVDSALAKPFDERDVTPDILGIGRLRGTKEAVLDEKVMKSGRTTRKTDGTVMDVSATLRVGYQTGSYVFTDQMIIKGERGAFSAGGIGRQIENSPASSRSVGTPSTSSGMTCSSRTRSGWI